MISFEGVRYAGNGDAPIVRLAEVCTARTAAADRGQTVCLAANSRRQRTG
jgi:hypothetical protein